MSLSDYSLLDKALYRLSRSGALLKNGFVNHAPMAAEALVAMGKAEEAEAWVGRQLAHLMPERESQRDLRDFDWQENLGDLSTDAAWRGLFAKELEVADWRPVLDCWSRRLAPGLSAAATHGIIRVGHAARALGVEGTPLRRRELSEGLALWAGQYQSLPTAFSATVAPDNPTRALARVPMVPGSLRRNDGAITTALCQLDQVPEFAGVISLIDKQLAPSETACEIARTFAQVFLDQVHTPLSAIVFTHAVTAIAAILNLAPHVSEQTTRELLTYGWQAACGLYSCYGETPFPGPGVGAEETVEQIAAEAVRHGDDHVIKLSEVCIGFYQATRDKRFLMLPAHARSLLA